MSSTAAIGSSSSYAQSPAIRAKVISLTSARSTVVLGRVVYRHDQRKISDATVRTLAHVAPCPAGRPLSERKCGHSLARATVRHEPNCSRETIASLAALMRCSPTPARALTAGMEDEMVAYWVARSKVNHPDHRHRVPELRERRSPATSRPNTLRPRRTARRTARASWRSSSSRASETHRHA